MKGQAAAFSSGRGAARREKLYEIVVHYFAPAFVGRVEGNSPDVIAASSGFACSYHVAFLFTSRMVILERRGEGRGFEIVWTHDQAIWICLYINRRKSLTHVTPLNYWFFSLPDHVKYHH